MGKGRLTKKNGHIRFHSCEMSGTGKFIETGSRLEFGVKKREALGRGMGFHFEVKKMFKNCLVMVAYV